MEPTQPQQQPMQPLTASGMGQPNVVGFPTAKPKGNSKTKWIVVVMVVVVLVMVAVGWLLIKRSSGEGSEPTPSPETGVLSSYATPEATVEPTETPGAGPVEKSEVKIEVLNGTGTAGDAGLVKTALTKLGYTDVEAANAESQEEVRTTVTFTRELDSAVIDEITEALEGIFAEVRVRKGSLAEGVDVRILTGPKKGTSASSASPSPTPEASATPTASPEVE